MDGELDVKPLERNPGTGVREGRGSLGHHIVVPESVFVQELEMVAWERFGEGFDRLTPESRAAIEDEVTLPLHWNARPNYHAPGCPACSAP